MRWRHCFKGLLRDGGRADFSKKPPGRFLLERSIELANLRPDPSRWTVPLKYAPVEDRKMMCTQGLRDYD